MSDDPVLSQFGCSIVLPNLEAGRLRLKSLQIVYRLQCAGKRLARPVASSIARQI